MSKVYSFRLDDNNPREAQAREVINAWISKGYSLRHILIESLILFGNENSNNSGVEELLIKLMDLVASLDKGGLTGNGWQEELPTKFISSISNSIKSGLQSK